MKAHELLDHIYIYIYIYTYMYVCIYREIINIHTLYICIIHDVYYIAFIIYISNCLKWKSIESFSKILERFEKKQKPGKYNKINNITKWSAER